MNLDSIDDLLNGTSPVSVSDVEKHVDSTCPHVEYARNARYAVPFSSCAWYGPVTVLVDDPRLSEGFPASRRDVARYARLTTPIPALILGWDGRRLFRHDGEHRLAAAKVRGDASFTAYIGIPRDPNLDAAQVGYLQS
jgi:hypothetical protein